MWYNNSFCKISFNDNYLNITFITEEYFKSGKDVSKNGIWADFCALKMTLFYKYKLKVLNEN